MRINTSVDDHSKRFEHALECYLEVYMKERNPEKIQELLAEQFSGFGTGEDEYFTDITGGMNIFKRDIETAPNPLICTVHKKSLQQIKDDHAIATVIFDLKAEILGQEIRLNKLRLMVSFIEIQGEIKISGMHISFPSIVHGKDESYPLKELEDRMQVIGKMVEEETKTLKEAYKELSQIINMDKLTGLYSRNYMDEMMEDIFEQFRRFGRIYSLIIIDIDDFKYVNDNYGHHIGDEVLKITAKTVQEMIRNTDKAFRWGGDEMVVILPQTSMKEAEEVAKRMMIVIEERAYPIKEKVTTSVGISSVRSEDACVDVFNRADQAMYQAKELGKNRMIIIP